MRAIATLLVAVAAAAQQSGRVEFEVVSVKRGDPSDPGSSARSTPGGLELRNATLNTLVRSAYRLNEYELDGGPKWGDSARFHIDARFPAGASRDQGPLMLQAMLADRFKLQFHRETRTMKQYALVVAKNGPKLERTAEGEARRGASSQGPRQIKGWGQPVSALARMLISAVGAPVVDHTGLSGEYNFVLEFSSLIETPPPDETLPAIFVVQLEPVRGPVEVLVIDRAEMPSEN